MFGTLGAASSVRQVDLASVDTTALVMQLDQQANEPRRRRFRRRLFVGAHRSSVSKNRSAHLPEGDAC